MEPILIAPSSSTESHRRGGFTLLELMLVMAIISILLVMAVPAVNSTATNYRLTDTTARIAAMIEFGRIHATAMQRVVDMRFFVSSNSNTEYTAAALFEMTPVSGSTTTTLTTKQLTPYFRFSEPIILSKIHSSLLFDNSTAGSGSATIPGNSAPSAYRDFLIFPDGSTSLTTSGTNPYLGILSRPDASHSGNPNNPCVLSIDPATCRVTTYRK